MMPLKVRLVTPAALRTNPAFPCAVEWVPMIVEPSAEMPLAEAKELPGRSGSTPTPSVQTKPRRLPSSVSLSPTTVLPSPETPVGKENVPPRERMVRLPPRKTNANCPLAVSSTPTTVEPSAETYQAVTPCGRLVTEVWADAEVGVVVKANAITAASAAASFRRRWSS